MQSRCTSHAAPSNRRLPPICGASRQTLCFSRGIFRQPHLEVFIPELLPLKKVGIAASLGVACRPPACHCTSCRPKNAITTTHAPGKNVTKLPLFTFLLRHKTTPTKAPPPSSAFAFSSKKNTNVCDIFRTNFSAVVGWGHKVTAAHARAYANKHMLPYIALEDGFVRSLTLASAGYPAMSMVVDHQGIYYDAHQPSDLEQLIHEAPGRQNETLLMRARNGMQLLRHQRLSKYNHAPERQLPAKKKMRRVLVVDQTSGDASIEGGMATQATFLDMLREVCAEPETEVWVKTHPDVIAGKKQGYLVEEARRQGCTLLSDDINPWSLFDQVDAVHVVTSQLGFEALLAGLPVTCHGLPFYAGWGLTEDRQACERRGESRRLEQVFAAAYLEYSRYANPYTGERASLEEVLQLLADQKRQSEYMAGHWIAPGYSRWKRGFLPAFLGPWARCDFTRRESQALETLTNATSAQSSPSRVLSWASRTTPGFVKSVKNLGGDLWHIEDGFLRSIGLGVDLARPLSLIVDDKAMHFDAQRASTLENWLEYHEFDDAELARARRLRERIVALGLSKYNAEHDTLLDLRALAGEREIVLVVGQVESDASIRHACPGIKTHLELLEAARELHPDAYMIYKPHPDVVSGGRRGEMSGENTPEDLVLTSGDICQLFEQVDHVHTLCSLAGFEALLRGVEVTTHGLPFYAGWGLTHDRVSCERRTRRLSLDALVAGALIEYPLYVDPVYGHHCNAETVVTILEQQRAMLRNGGNNYSLPWKTRLYRSYRALFIGKH
ncbi:capsular polysaccharide export protein, LipB/KpsS family [Cobetia sp. MM1IDA2H-1]